MAHGFEAFAIPESSFDGRPYLFGLPIFKLLFEGGYFAVPIFFVMSGYVCSMKPLKLSRAGKPDEARRSIATSAFRRIIRLGIPASLATTISWFLANVGGFDLAMSLADECWLNFHSGRPSANWYEAFKELYHELVHPD
jgi:peptidoglycan/LPS O-acetylase OafA/YrhL